MLLFKKIRWKNFLSTGNLFTEVKFTTAKTTLISGQNGHGKSTILDALAFSLFGKTFRNINLPQLTNSINQRDCLVELEFSVGGSEYLIRRGMDPKLFEIYKNGTLIEQSAKSKDYQKQLEETVLKMSFKAFCQVVILGSSNYIPFMRLTAADRRSIVESILDIDVFTSMNTVLKGKVNENREMLREINSKLELHKEKLKAQKRILDNIHNLSREAIVKNEHEMEKSKKKIKSLSSKQNFIQTKIQERMESISDFGKVRERISKFSSVESQLSRSCRSLDNDIQKYAEMTHCSSCNQEINEDHKCAMVERKTSKKNDMEKALKELLEKRKTIQERLDRIQETQEEIHGLQGELVSIQSEVSAHNSYISKLQKDNEKILSSDEEKTKEKTRLELLLEEEKTILSNREEVAENDNLYGLASVLLKDTGIKKRIIAHYIPVINKVINSYLQQMNFFVLFELDEEFNEKIRSRHRDEFTYNSFSEGEKRKIDLALLFAWRKIAQLKNSVSTNLLVLDEILDGSLDNTSTESFLDIISNLDKNTNLFVISHKPKEVIQDRFENQITFVKKNNFSQIEK
jgi:DNA repair exonuclease SbcCD ATPase subunit